MHRLNAGDSFENCETEVQDATVVNNGEEAVFSDVEFLESRSGGSTTGHWKTGARAAVAAALLALLAALLTSAVKCPSNTETEAEDRGCVENILRNEDLVADAHESASRAIDSLVRQRNAYSGMRRSGQLSDEHLYLPLLRSRADDAKKALRVEVITVDSLIDAFEDAAAETAALSQRRGSFVTDCARVSERADFLEKLPRLLGLTRDTLESEWNVVRAMKQEFDRHTVIPHAVQEAYLDLQRSRKDLAVEFARLQPAIQSLGLTNAFASIESLAKTNRFE